jgi:hypothetical protein
MDERDPGKTDWKWRYSIWTGVMYGPIPVGFIVVITLVICFAVYTITN